MEIPSVSICIPAYNSAAVIGDALRSALCQEHARLEILVLDNHSTDETGKIVNALSAGDSRVRYSRNPENIGMARNFNACIAAATGEYVQILCSDDILEPDSVNRLSTALREHRDAVFVAGGRTFTDHELRPKRVILPRSRQEEIAPNALMRECFIRGNVIGEPSAVMFRKSAAGRGFSAEYSQSVDLELWFHLLSQGSAVLLPEVICKIRQHEGQVTEANMKSGRIVEDKRLLFRQYIDHVMPSLGVREKFTWDARMASSVARCREFGGTVNAKQIAEVFYPNAFLQLLLPLVSAAWSARGAFAAHRL